MPNSRWTRFAIHRRRRLVKVALPPDGPTDERKPGVFQVFRKDRDEGFSVARCKSGLNASEVLAVARTWEKAYWERVIKFWKAQLTFALRREQPPTNDDIA